MEKDAKDGLVKIAVLEGVEGTQQREECVGGEQVDCPPVVMEAKNEPIGSNPFAVFPHEVWGKIVRALTQENPEDAWNLIKTYPELREEVINKREVLFYKVLPLLFPDLDKSSVLACRQVCKSWRITVDQFLEEHPSQKPYQPETSFLNETGYRYHALEDKNMEFMINCLSSDFQDKLSVLESARESNVAPPSIVGRSASFFYNNPAPVFHNQYLAHMMAYYNSLCAFLERIGSTIETVSLPLTGKTHILNVMAHYEGFARCLWLLPNLKGLRVDTLFDHLVFRDINNGERFRERQQLIQLVQDFPLPELANLRSLILNAESRFGLLGRCDNSVYIPLQDIYLHVLRTYGTQIEKLCIDPFAVETCTEVQLNNVTDLQILRGIDGRNVERMVQLLQSVDAEKLKKLEICDPMLVPRSRIFSMLERFQQLELFGIKMYKDYFPREDEKLPAFPNVKALKLDIAEPTEWIENQNPSENPDSHFPGMNMLNAFPNLEYLEIRLVNSNFENYGDMRIYQEDEIGMKLLQCKVYMGPEKQEMEIWKLLPRLKTLIVGNKRFEN